MMSDKVLLQNMMFYGFHGVYEYEKEMGQRFFVDVEYEVDAHQAGQSDDLADTVDYTTVYQHIKQIAEQKQFQLIEALAENIAAAVLEWKSIAAVTVRVRKPSIPLPGPIDFFQVETHRRR
jgi:dihydroneopterin aldolase